MTERKTITRSEMGWRMKMNGGKTKQNSHNSRFGGQFK